MRKSTRLKQESTKDERTESLPPSSLDSLSLLSSPDQVVSGLSSEGQTEIRKLEEADRQSSMETTSAGEQSSSDYADSQRLGEEKQGQRRTARKGSRYCFRSQFTPS